MKDSEEIPAHQNLMIRVFKMVTDVRVRALAASAFSCVCAILGVLGAFAISVETGWIFVTLSLLISVVGFTILFKTYFLKMSGDEAFGRLIGDEAAQEVLGDLEEIFLMNCILVGRFNARVRYFGSLIRLLSRYAWKAVMRIALLGAPTGRH